MFGLPTLVHRLCYSGQQMSRQCLRSTLSVESRINHLPLMLQIRGFKDKEILKIRCNDCYFKKVDDRWWVLCNTHPRHKQRQKIDDIRNRWIVTHVTRTGHPFKKHYQYPGQDL